ncbi:tRNA1(Val) (adenine(37)-N6)-methyltransferase [Tistrella mobilis]|nr:methyltransferase [Tistrella mobilis]
MATPIDLQDRLTRHGIDPSAVSLDHLLGRRVQLVQFIRGYRAAVDPVLLAAAVPAEPGQRVLDLGLGTGAASLCLAARVPGLRLVGVERDAGAAALARVNAGLAGAALTVVETDVGARLQGPDDPRTEPFDHVLTNPPFLEEVRADPPPDPGRRAAHVEGGTGLGAWIAAGLRRLKPGGSFTIVMRADRLAEILTALAGPAGDIRVLPVHTVDDGRPAGRVIVQARKGRRTPLTLLAPLVLAGEGRDWTLQAGAVLEDAAPLPLAAPSRR